MLTNDLKEVKQYINESTRKQPNIAVFNFDGGLKDIYSGDALAKEKKIAESSSERWIYG